MLLQFCYCIKALYLAQCYTRCLSRFRYWEVQFTSIPCGMVYTSSKCDISIIITNLFTDSVSGAETILSAPFILYCLTSRISRYSIFVRLKFNRFELLMSLCASFHAIICNTVQNVKHHWNEQYTCIVGFRVLIGLLAIYSLSVSV